MRIFFLITFDSLQVVENVLKEPGVPEEVLVKRAKVRCLEYLDYKKYLGFDIFSIVRFRPSC